MRRIPAVLGGLLTALSLGAATAAPGIVIEVLLTDRLARQEGIDAFVPALELTPERFVLVASPSRFYVLGWGGLAPIASPATAGISSFAYSSDGLLFVVAGTQLAYVDSTGAINPLFELPSAGMHVARGADRMYLYERQPARDNGLYAYFKGRTYRKVLDSPDPIAAVVEVNDRVFFATGKAIYRFTLGTPLKLLLAAPDHGVIQSLAVDVRRNIVFFATDRGVFAVLERGVTPIREGLTGTLKWHDEALYVFNAPDRMLLRLVGVGDALTGGPARRRNKGCPQKQTGARGQGREGPRQRLRCANPKGMFSRAGGLNGGLQQVKGARVGAENLCAEPGEGAWADEDGAPTSGAQSCGASVNGPLTREAGAGNPGATAEGSERERVEGGREEGQGVRGWSARHGDG